MADFKIFFIKRIVSMFVTLLFVSVVVFGATQLLPGSVAEQILGQHQTEERIEEIEEELALNEPIHHQYVDWISGVVTGDWGQSYMNDQPVRELLIDRALISGQLAGLAFLLVIFVAIPLGVVAAVKRDSSTDTFISGVAYISISIPEFVLGTLLLLLFGGPVFHIFPTGNFVPFSEGPRTWLLHLTLPVVTMTILMAAHIMRQARSGVIEEIQAEYTRTARLKGLSEFKVMIKHVLRNGLLPTITILALNVGWLLGGIVVVEEVFSYPGVGRLFVRAIQNRDLPLIQITVLFITVAYIVANFVADVTYTYLDPRIDYGE